MLKAICSMLNVEGNIPYFAYRSAFRQLNNLKMNTTKLSGTLLIVVLSVSIISCKPSFTIRTSALWVNKEKLPPEPLKSIFIIAFTDNMDVRSSFEKDLADAAQKRGLKAYKS